MDKTNSPRGSVNRPAATGGQNVSTPPRWIMCWLRHPNPKMNDVPVPPYHNVQLRRLLMTGCRLEAFILVYTLLIVISFYWAVVGDNQKGTAISLLPCSQERFPYLLRQTVKTPVVHCPAHLNVGSYWDRLPKIERPESRSLWLGLVRRLPSSALIF